MKESFLIFKSFYEPIKGLSKEDKGDLLDAIFQFQIDGIEPMNTSRIYMPFMFFKNQFRLDNLKYQKIINRNRTNGSKGGRPIKPKKPKKPSGLIDNPKNPSEPKKPDNVNVNVNDNVNENKTVPANKFAREREILNNVYNLFDFKVVRNLTETQKNTWLETINKLKRIDGFEYGEIQETIIWGRTDEFWKANFNSISGLRKKNNEVSKFFNINKKMNYEQTGKNGHGNKEVELREFSRNLAESIANDPDLI